MTTMEQIYMTNQYIEHSVTNTWCCGELFGQVWKILFVKKLLVIFLFFFYFLVLRYENNKQIQIFREVQKLHTSR